jgi:uncharacterized membrane protein YkvI
LTTDSPSSWFHRIFLPPIILQSVLIGGGYSTGREVVEYAGKHGSMGWISVLIIFAGFSLVSALAFELARVCRAYDYKTWIRPLIGRLWPLFDILVIVMALLVLAVMVSAVGSILEDTIGVPNTAGVVLALVAAAVLIYLGDRIIERFKTFGTLVLYVGYAVFGILVLYKVGGNIGDALADPSSTSSSTPWAAACSGFLYVGYNASSYPAVLFAVHRQRSRADTIVSGIVAGVMMTVPFALTWLCLVGFYPAEDVLKAEVPWLAMLEGLGGTWVIVLYGIVVGWTLVETSVGSVHAILHRVDQNMQDLPSAISSRIHKLTALHRGLGAAAILLIAMLLSRFGIIALVAKGYTLMAYGFIALLVLPLLTIGLVRIIKAGQEWPVGQKGLPH